MANTAVFSASPCDLYFATSTFCSDCYLDTPTHITYPTNASATTMTIYKDAIISCNINGYSSGFTDQQDAFDNLVGTTTLFAPFPVWFQTDDAENQVVKINVYGQIENQPLFPASTTNYLSIQPTYPIDCAFNYNANATSTASGYIYNPTSTQQSFYYITMSLTDTLTGYAHIATSTALVFNLYDEPIHAGDWATYNFDFAIGTSTYYIDYFLEGDIFTFAPQHCYTTIGTATSTARPPIINQPIYTAEEDCSLATSTTDRLLCELKNFFTGLFFPSGEKVIELQNNLKELNNRFPISYINVLTTFATDLNNNNTDIVLITFFNATTSVDFTSMDTTIDYGEENTGFMERLRQIFSAVLIFGFGIWGIIFLRRVFK